MRYYTIFFSIQIVIDKIEIKIEIGIGIATGGIDHAVEIVESAPVLAPRIAETERGVIRRRRAAAPGEENRRCIGMCRRPVSNTLLPCRQDYLLPCLGFFIKITFNAVYLHICVFHLFYSTRLCKRLVRYLQTS